MWFHYKPKYVGKGRERALMKIIVSFRSYPKRNRKLHKNSKKIEKNTIMASFQAKIGRKMLCERERIKIILPFHSYPRCDRKFQKNDKKIHKI